VTSTKETSVEQESELSQEMVINYFTYVQYTGARGSVLG
jgi:hypothetical protein